MKWGLSGRGSPVLSLYQSLKRRQQLLYVELGFLQTRTFPGAEVQHEGGRSIRQPPACSLACSLRSESGNLERMPGMVVRRVEGLVVPHKELKERTV